VTAKGAYQLTRFKYYVLRIFTNYEDALCRRVSQIPTDPQLPALGLMWIPDMYWLVYLWCVCFATPRLHLADGPLNDFIAASVVPVGPTVALFALTLGWGCACACLSMSL
jgi:hypothetical protein